MTLPTPLWRKAAPTGFICGAVLAATAAFAQEGGGISYTFGITQRLQHDSNPGLATPSAASETTSRTRLSFGVASETRLQRLALTAQGSFVGGDNNSKGIASPSAELSYRLEGASSQLNLAAFLRETDVDALDFTASIGAGGVPILTATSGTGTQRRKGATAKLDFGIDAPFGGSLSLGLTDTTYTNTTDPSLVDNSRSTARVALRFALTETLTATAALGTSRLTEVGAAAVTTETLSLGVDQALANGAITLDSTMTRTNSGSRTSLSLGRSLDLPNGALSVSIGASSRIVGGGTQTIAALNWSHDLALGKVTLGLSHAIGGTERDAEAEVTQLRLGLAHSLTPRLGMTANLGLQDSRETLAGTRTRSTDLSAALNYELTPDWGLDMGASHRIRNETGAGRARSSTVFVAVGRSFEFRP